MNMVQTSYYQRWVKIAALICRHPNFSTVSLNFRNQAKLRAYQREYAWQKRAPGRRKVSKAERELLEDQYVKKQELIGAEGQSKPSSASFSQYVLPSLII
jgi:hypothetical protein